jgi:hypothetical protein
MRRTVKGIEPPGQQFANAKPQPHEIAPRNSNKTITKLQNQ